MPDAYMLLSYGGPNKPEDVVPFLRNAVAGRGIPDERLKIVGEHYYRFGGKSPINELNAQLVAALQEELGRRGDHTPVVVGNRNWHPFGGDVLKKLYDAGVRRVRAMATSAYASYSSCRQYQEDVQRWLGEVGQPDLVVDKVRPFWDDDAFFEVNRDIVRDAVAKAPDSRLVFVTHSIPTAMNEASGADFGLNYQAQHLKLVRRITEELGIKEWDLAYCSRSGSPHTPWLEPDINDHIEDLAARGETGVVIVPIGFISDHMEVKYDLDTQAKETAERVGIAHHRAPTVGTDPRFVRALADLLQASEVQACSASCCLSGATRPAGRHGRPA